MFTVCSQLPLSLNGTIMGSDWNHRCINTIIQVLNARFLFLSNHSHFPYSSLYEVTLYCSPFYLLRVHQRSLHCGLTSSIADLLCLESAIFSRLEVLTDDFNYWFFFMVIMVVGVVIAMVVSMVITMVVSMVTRVVASAGQKLLQVGRGQRQNGGEHELKKR